MEYFMLQFAINLIIYSVLIGITWFILKVISYHKEDSMLRECAIRNGKNALGENPVSAIYHDGHNYDKALIVRRLNSDYGPYTLNDLQFELYKIAHQKQQNELDTARLETLNSMINDHIECDRDRKSKILHGLKPFYYITAICLCAYAVQLTTNAGGLLVLIELSVSWWISKRIFISISNFKMKRCLFYNYQPNQDTLPDEPFDDSEYISNNITDALEEASPISAEKTQGNITELSTNEIFATSDKRKRKNIFTGMLVAIGVFVLLTVIILIAVSLSSDSSNVTYDSNWKNIDTFNISSNNVSVPENDYSCVTITSYENFESAYDTYSVSYACDDEDTLVGIKFDEWYLNDDNRSEINLRIIPLSSGNTTISLFYTSDDGEILGNVQTVNVQIVSPVEHYDLWSEIPSFSSVSSSALIASDTSDGQTYYTYDSHDTNEISSYTDLLNNCGFTYYGEVSIDDSHSLYAYWRNGYIVYVGDLSDGINVTIGEYS